MPCAFRGMTMTGKILVFISNMIKGEGRPRGRQMIELSPAASKARQMGKKGEREAWGLPTWKNAFVPGVEGWGLGVLSQDSQGSLQFELLGYACPGEAEGAWRWLCGWTVWLWRHRKLITAPRVWCPGGRAGTPEEPLTMAGLQESTGLHPGTGRGSI